LEEEANFIKKLKKHSFDVKTQLGLHRYTFDFGLSIEIFAIQFFCFVETQLTEIGNSFFCLFGTAGSSCQPARVQCKEREKIPSFFSKNIPPASTSPWGN
jgi:hypothetical protein